MAGSADRKLLPCWTAGGRVQGLLAAAAGDVDPERLLAAPALAQWAALPDALPVIALSFVYQNVVPVITTSLEGDIVKIRCGDGVGGASRFAWRSVSVGGRRRDAAAARLAP